jgi:hypothetical protein
MLDLFENWFAVRVVGKHCKKMMLARPLQKGRNFLTVVIDIGLMRADERHVGRILLLSLEP